MASAPIACCHDDDIATAQHRTPVIDREGRLTGMVSLSDIAARGTGAAREETVDPLERIAQPWQARRAALGQAR